MLLVKLFIVSRNSSNISPKAVIGPFIDLIISANHIENFINAYPMATNAPPAKTEETISTISVDPDLNLPTILSITFFIFSYISFIKFHIDTKILFIILANPDKDPNNLLKTLLTTSINDTIAFLIIVNILVIFFISNILVKKFHKVLSIETIFDTTTFINFNNDFNNSVVALTKLINTFFIPFMILINVSELINFFMK